MREKPHCLPRPYQRPRVRPRKRTPQSGPFTVEHLSVRAWNCLRNANVKNLYELVLHGVEPRMAGVKNCGHGTLQELYQAVECIEDDLRAEGITDIVSWVEEELGKRAVSNGFIKSHEAD